MAEEDQAQRHQIVLDLAQAQRWPDIPDTFQGGASTQKVVVASHIEANRVQDKHRGRKAYDKRDECKAVLNRA